MFVSGRFEIRRQAERVEQPIGSEASGHFGPIARGCVNAAERIADRCRGCEIDDARPKLILPHRVGVRGEIGHRETTGRPILAENPRYGARDDCGGDAHPFDLGPVALDRNAPVSGHLELRPVPALRRPDRRAGPREDFGRHATRQWEHLHCVSAHFQHSRQCIGQFGRN
jgi:hypothetical protein